MSTSDSEWQLVGQFWLAAEQGKGDAWKAQAMVAPEMIQHAGLAAFYRIVTHRFAAGQSVAMSEIGSEVQEAGALDTVTEIWDRVVHCTTLMHHAGIVFKGWQARKQVALLRVGMDEAEKSLEKPERARKVAERLSMALLDVFSSDPSQSRPQSRDELVDYQLEAMDWANEPGVALPWPKMQDSFGPLAPGDVVGLTGYSGSGKSTVAANLAMGLARRGTPVIVFPTEMREQWVARCAAAQSRVAQKIAEKRLWKRATEEERKRYRAALERMRDWPWEVVNRSSVSPAEIVAATRTLRRVWPNRHVVVFVDHMHRLDYGKEEADAEVGNATKLLKNFATDDKAGLSFVLLYQPKKPEAEHAVYQPISASRIRGHSAVWNELDVHMSVFRTWVERSPFGFTEWGSPACMYDADGRPKLAKPFAQGAHVDEEHTYLKPDKRRIEGEGPTFWLSMHKPSGDIYEGAGERSEEAA